MHASAGFIGFIGATSVFLVASLIPFFKGVKNNEVNAAPGPPLRSAPACPPCQAFAVVTLLS